MITRYKLIFSKFRVQVVNYAHVGRKTTIGMGVVNFLFSSSSSYPSSSSSCSRREGSSAVCAPSFSTWDGCMDHPPPGVRAVHITSNGSLGNRNYTKISYKSWKRAKRIPLKEFGLNPGILEAGI